MFKKWKKGHHHDPQREKVKEELFAFKKTIEHGFPHQPSALAFDRKLKLMALGTKNGAVKIYGAPGVEFTGIHEDVNQVVQLHFLPGEARLVSILDDNTMHLWELTLKNDKRGSQALVEVGAFQLSVRPGINQITEVVIKSTNDMMWVGTESGGIYPLSLPDFEPRDGGIIHQDQVMQSIPDSYKTGKALGPVEAIAEHPHNSSLVLIGYSRGLVVLWNDQTRNVEEYFLGNQQLEAVAWNSNGQEFMTAHNDGSLCTWQVNNSEVTPTPNIPYGPFPCKAITKVLWKTSKTQPFVVFSGGMPRANYGDRHCVSVICGRDHVTFDITSRIIDYFAICQNAVGEDENPEYLIILAEEEIIAIDLTQEGWPSLTPPYLASLHSSPITCSAHVSSVPSLTWQKIKAAAENANKYDGKNKKRQHVSFDTYWPIDGGINLTTRVGSDAEPDILLTGHEDGTIKFWDATSSAMSPIMKLYTAQFFVTDGDGIDHDAFEDEYPPFRKVGEFDPYSDDPKLGIKKLAMCGQTGTIVAGGTAGQVIVYVLSEDAIESGLVTKEVDILSERAGFTWKGHEKLKPKDLHLSMDPGYQINNLVQCSPPASITAINVQAQWGLLGFGTSHGYALYDYQQNKCILSRCTLETGDHMAMEGHFSRAKSFKMSLRQSIRRLRGSFRGGGGGSKRRVSGRRRNYRRGDMSKKLQEANAALVDEEETASAGWSPAGQRKVEARTSDEGMSGMIRCIYFATTYIRDTVSLSPTFWAGTNSGSVYVYGLDIPDYSKRQELEVTSILGKEIQLMHRAPVIDVTVVDSQGCPMHQNMGGKALNGTAHGAPSHHFLVISSEEQFKVFSLPKISPRKKLKLTAVDGSLVRKVCHARFDSGSNPDYKEHALVCLTNQGEILIISVLPSFRPQVQYQCIGPDDPHGISSSILTSTGQGFYLLSSSEYERFSMSTCSIVEPYCRVALDPSTPIAPLPTKQLASAQIEQNEDNHTEKDISVNKSPSKTPSRMGREGSVVVASTTTSPKQPLLGDSEDEEEVDDTQHVARHESVLEEAERTLAELDIGTPGGSDDGEINVQDLLGAVAEAEKNLAKK